MIYKKYINYSTDVSSGDERSIISSIMYIKSIKDDIGIYLSNRKPKVMPVKKFTLY